MSKINVAKRFSDAMKKKDIYQSVSLPMICNDTEIIFFYYLSLTESGFVLKELGDIAIRDIKNSNIIIKKSSEFFIADEITEFTNEQEVRCLTGSKALECVNRYYDLHEELLAHKFHVSVSETEKELLKNYLEMFSLIVPKSVLRKIYFRIGKSMFRYIFSRTGQKLEL